MRSLLFLSALLAAGVPAFGKLGETEEELKKRVPNATLHNKGGGPLRVYTFIKNEVKVKISALDGKVISETYWNLNEHEAAGLLIKHYGKLGKRNEPKEGMILWDYEDEKWIAVYTVKTSALDVFDDAKWTPKLRAESHTILGADKKLEGL